MSGRTTGMAQWSAGAAGLLFVAAATGWVPMAGLTPKGSARETPIAPPPLEIGTGTPPVEPVTPTPAVSSAQPRVQASLGPFTTTAELSHGQLWRRGDGGVWVRCEVEAAAGEGQRLPIDLVLVLDTSGSMSGAMDLLKRATLGLAERLSGDDRLAVVAYSSQARVVFPLQAPRGGSQAELERAVAGLVAAGGTNLSEGLRLGGEQLQRNLAGREVARATRLVLMTDGLANQGVTDPAALERMVRGLREGGALSSVGLGTNYNEDLLATLADAGGGAYHYVREVAGLAGVYRAEVEALAGLAGQEARLTLIPASGVRVAEVVSWPCEMGAEETTVRLGDLSHGRRVKVLARLEVSRPAEAGEELLQVAFAYREPEQRELRSQVLEPLGASWCGDEATARQSEREGLRDDLRQLTLVREVERARGLAAAGEAEEAQRVLREAKDKTGETALRYRAADGRAVELDLEQLGNGFMEAPGSADAQDALKSSAEAARAMAR